MTFLYRVLFPRAQRFPARGWVLAEQTCIARGSPVHPKLACVEMPFPLGVLQDGDRKAKACTQPIQTIQRGENIFHNSSPSFKDASCPRPEKASITQVSRMAQSCTKLCVAAGHSSSAPTATCNLFFKSLQPARQWLGRSTGHYIRRHQDNSRPFQAFISRKYRSPSPSATSSVQVPLNPWTSKLCFFNTFPKLVRRIGHPRAQHSLVCTDSTGTASLRGTPKPLAAIPNRTPTVPRSLLALLPRSLS